MSIAHLHYATYTSCIQLNPNQVTIMHIISYHLLYALCSSSIIHLQVIKFSWRLLQRNPRRLRSWASHLRPLKAGPLCIPILCKCINKLQLFICIVTLPYDQCTDDFLIELSYLDVTTPLKCYLFTFKYQIIHAQYAQMIKVGMMMVSHLLRDIGHDCPLMQHKWIMI